MVRLNLLHLLVIWSSGSVEHTLFSGQMTNLVSPQNGQNWVRGISWATVLLLFLSHSVTQMDEPSTHPNLVSQTSKWTNTYPTNGNQSHLEAFRHIRPTLKNQSFWLFGHWVVGCSEVNYQLLSRSPRVKPSDIIWMDSVEPEYEVSNVKDGRVKNGGRMRFYHYLREK